jgi:hypothetical protein
VASPGALDTRVRRVRGRHGLLNSKVGIRHGPIRNRKYQRVPKDETFTRRLQSDSFRSERLPSHARIIRSVGREEVITAVPNRIGIALAVRAIRVLAANQLVQQQVLLEAPTEPRDRAADVAEPCVGVAEPTPPAAPAGLYQ